MSNRSAPSVTTAMLVCGTFALTIMVAAISLQLALGRDPGVLINFCGLIISQSATFGFLYFKLDKTAEKVEYLANSGGDQKAYAAARRALTDHVGDTLAQEKIAHPASE